MKILKDEKITPFYFGPGDHLTVSYDSPDKGYKNEVVCEAVANVGGTVDRALIFENETEKGVLLGGVVGADAAVEEFKGRIT